jgi:quinoprotein glucose dehydrogenase
MTTGRWKIARRAKACRFTPPFPPPNPAELTPANGLPKRKTFLTWQRSHGDNGGMRYSALTQINRRNVADLAVAWTYHSHDNGVPWNAIPSSCATPCSRQRREKTWSASTPPPAWNCGALNPEAGPAFRGLIYWPGRPGAAERILFSSGPCLYALDPKPGSPSNPSASMEKLPCRAGSPGYGAASAAPTIYKEIIIVPGYHERRVGL